MEPNINWSTLLFKIEPIPVPMVNLPYLNSFDTQAQFILDENVKCFLDIKYAIIEPASPESAWKITRIKRDTIKNCK